VRAHPRPFFLPPLPRYVGIVAITFPRGCTFLPGKIERNPFKLPVSLTTQDFAQLRSLSVKKLLLALLVTFGLFQLLGENDPLGPEPSVLSNHSQLSAQELELHNTLERIRQNGPYPYQRDGITFENRERLLPIKPRGYYREYTVDTPGLSHRGPRRVVTGGNPPEVFYYTQDHYSSFVLIQGH